jgi:hypothetical protein
MIVATRHPSIDWNVASIRRYSTSSQQLPSLPLFSKDGGSAIGGEAMHRRDRLLTKGPIKGLQRPASDLCGKSTSPD